MTFTIITQFESARTTFNTVTSMDNQTVEVTQEESVVQSQDSFDLSNNFASSSSNDVSNNQNYEQQQLENASSPSSPRGITKKKRKNSKNTFIDFPSVITTVSNNNNPNHLQQASTQQQSQHQDDMWMQGVLFQFKNACLCSSYSSSYSIKQKKPNNNPTGVLVSNRRTI